MGRSGRGRRKRSSNDGDRYIQRFQHLEHQALAAAVGTGQADLRKIRARVYKLVHEVEASQKSFEGRGELLVRARGLLRVLADVNRQNRTQGSGHKHAPETPEARLLAMFDVRLKRLAKEAERLHTECVDQLAQGRPLGADVEQREDALHGRCASLATDIELRISDRVQRDQLLESVQACRANLLKRPGAGRSRNRDTGEETISSLRARRRRALELDGHDRGDVASVSSVYTVPFGLPGLGKHR